MKPEPRIRKKTEVFDPHPPESKHQMMADRSRKVKEKNQKVDSKMKNRDRMRSIREKETKSCPKKKTPKKKKTISKA